jgi:predicted acetyltransferase
MILDISPASIQEEQVLRNLLELYSYDFSTIDGADVDDSGLYGYEYLDLYWEDPDRYPFLIRVDGRLAGFALVREGSYFPESDLPRESRTWLIAEFFVMRKYRRRGIGEQVAVQLFDRFRGRWEIAQVVGNDEARAFWRAVISEYTGGNYSEAFVENERWHGPVQIFSNESSIDGKS